MPPALNILLESDAPSLGQLALLCLAAALISCSSVLAFLRLRKDTPALLTGSSSSLIAGVIAATALLVWHATTGPGRGIPLSDNFSTLIWLSLLLCLFVAYVQQRRPLAGLDAFILPITVLMLILAGVFGRATPHEYVAGTWSWVHRLSSYGGALGFAVAAASGAMYLVASARLRKKDPLSTASKLIPLERLEHISFTAVTLGFALLSVGMVTGIFRVSTSATRLGELWFISPKVLLATAVWLIYALVLHAPINPSFRGRKSAWLSLLGFTLMASTIIAVQLIPNYPDSTLEVVPPPAASTSGGAR